MENDNYSFDEDWHQSQVIHCPKKDCKGMLLDNNFKRYLKCSDCGKHFTFAYSIEEIKDEN